MRYRLLLLYFLLAFSLWSLAFEINGNVWLLSSVTTNAVLKDKLKEAEFAARKNEFSEAAATLRKIEEEYAADNFVAEGEPFNLMIAGAALWYQSKAASFKDFSVVKEATRLLAKYAKEAEGLAWNNYKYLYHRKRDYYYCKKDFEKVLEVQKELILYDVNDTWAMDSYCEYITKHDLEDDSATFFSEVEKRGGKISARMQLQLLRQNFISGDDAAWKKLLTWFDKNRQADFETLKQGVTLASKYLDASDKKTVAEYVLALTNCVLGQPADDAHMPIIAYLLNERQKVKTLVAEAGK